MTTKELQDLCEAFANVLKGEDYPAYEDQETEQTIREAPGCHDAKGHILSHAKLLERRAEEVRHFGEALPDNLAERWEKTTS